MNISSINAYSKTSFGAKKSTNTYRGKHVKNNTPTIIKTVGGVTIGTAAALAMLIPGCQAEKPAEITTEPTAIYGELLETETTTPKETVSYEIATPANMINSIPMDEREKEEYHTVKAGDRLTDIVIKYAELDEDYPYEKLIPYFNRLKIENPGLIDDKYNVILIPGKSLRVDGILPENVIKNSPVNPYNPTEATEPTEIEETQPEQETSAEDTVNINGNIFTFDLGTLDKKLFGDYEGLMYGKFVKLDKKMGGNIELTKYEGTNADSNKSQVITYDEDGKIIEYVDYRNNEVVQTATYSYKPTSMVETTTDKTVKSGFINVVTTEYSNSDDITLSRTFSIGNDTVAIFNFSSGKLQIGETIVEFDTNTFSCNDDVIGSKRYTGYINGEPVRIDVLTTGFNIEYVNTNGQIESRQQFDTKGNLIYTE